MKIVKPILCVSLLMVGALACAMDNGSAGLPVGESSEAGLVVAQSSQVKSNIHAGVKRPAQDSSLGEKKQRLEAGFAQTIPLEQSLNYDALAMRMPSVLSAQLYIPFQVELTQPFLYPIILMPTMPMQSFCATSLCVPVRGQLVQPRQEPIIPIPVRLTKERSKEIQKRLAQSRAEQKISKKFANKKRVYNKRTLPEYSITLTEQQAMAKFSALMSHKCSVTDCRAQFITQGELDEHMVKHTQPFKCNRCEKSFKSPESEIRHRYEHHDQKLDCPKQDCAAVYNNIATLVKHIQEDHGAKGSEAQIAAWLRKRYVDNWHALLDNRLRLALGHIDEKDSERIEILKKIFQDAHTKVDALTIDDMNADPFALYQVEQ